MPYADRDIELKMCKIRSKKHWEKNKNNIDFIKRRRFYCWKHSGIKGDYEEIFQLYINQEKCYDCNVTLTDGKGRTCKATDHHHPSGHFRHIICQACNTSRGKIDRMRTSVCMELHRHFLLNN